MLKKINSLEYQSILVLCLLSSSIGISLYTTIKYSSIDSYISILIGNIIGLIPLFIFIYILNYEEDKSLYEKNINLFGKVFGKVINYLLSILFFILSSTILYNISNFITTQYLTETSILSIMMLLVIVLYITLNKGIETISRTSSIFLFVFVFLFILALLSVMNGIKLDNLEPILEYGLSSPLKGGIINSFIITIPFYSLLGIPKNNITDKNRLNKYIIVGYLLSSFILFLISIITNSILGKYLINIYQYPAYISLKKASIFSFLSRIENFFSLGWILSSYITIITNLYIAKECVPQKKSINIILIILMIFLSYKLFKNNTTFNCYIFKIYPFILLSLFLIFLLIFLTIIIKKKYKKNYNT